MGAIAEAVSAEVVANGLSRRQSAVNLVANLLTELED